MHPPWYLCEWFKGWDVLPFSTLFFGGLVNMRCVLICSVVVVGVGATAYDTPMDRKRHNWVHQPKYKWMAYLSLDLVGFSSDQWYEQENSILELS